MTTDQVCPECDGEGTIMDEVEEELESGEMYSYTEEVDCPECKGEGVITKDSDDAPS